MCVLTKVIGMFAFLNCFTVTLFYFLCGRQIKMCFFNKLLTKAEITKLFNKHERIAIAIEIGYASPGFNLHWINTRIPTIVYP